MLGNRTWKSVQARKVRVNVNKSKVVVVARKRVASLVAGRINDVVMKTVKLCTFLGSCFSEGSIMQDDMKM